uniref:LisH domain-containing protein n=1 Tax=Arcella intermedia TaxID=1963864 RepID=A0A6B2L202_9EUKA
MSFTSYELNYAIYRYLIEAGFDHSAFTFLHESKILEKVEKLDGVENVDTGALVYVLQKGLQFIEVERSFLKDGTEVQLEEPVRLLTPLKVKTRPKVKASIDLKRVDLNETMEQVDVTRKPPPPLDTNTTNSSDSSDVEIIEEGYQQRNPDDYKSPSNICVRLTGMSDSSINYLKGHNGQVDYCSWNPSQELLATSSNDKTVRIWDLSTGKKNLSISLQHDVGRDDFISRILVDWKPDGAQIATGGTDGVVKIWGKTGSLSSQSSHHKGPIACLKWSINGQYLLTASTDKTFAIWNGVSKEPEHQSKIHSEIPRDVDWRDSTTFSSCSGKVISHSKIGRHLRNVHLQGHTEAVNSLRWSPCRTLLASGSDDKTVKLWQIDKKTFVSNFEGHSKAVNIVEWSPTGTGSNNPNSKPLLASVSFDYSIRLWDVESQKPYHTFKHDETISSISFDPTGTYLASSSYDNHIHIWSIKDKILLKTFEGEDPILSVHWNYRGDKLAAGHINNEVSIIDMRAFLN